MPIALFAIFLTANTQRKYLERSLKKVLKKKIAGSNSGNGILLCERYAEDRY